MTARKTPRSTARRASARGGRIDFRMSPNTKDLLVRAAALRGTNLTSFVLESAQERAAEPIERHERLKLTNRDRDRLLAALAEPPRAVAALRRLFGQLPTLAG